MDERRDPPPPAGSQPEGIPSGAPLSPVQQAHAQYSSHAGTCPRCRDIDRERCDTGQQLWRAWNEACDDAYQRLNDAAG